MNRDILSFASTVIINPTIPHLLTMMQNSPSHSCCCARHTPADGENRRGFIARPWPCFAAALRCWFPRPSASRPF